MVRRHTFKGCVRKETKKTGSKRKAIEVCKEKFDK